MEYFRGFKLFSRHLVRSVNRKCRRKLRMQRHMEKGCWKYSIYKYNEEIETRRHWEASLNLTCFAVVWLKWMEVSIARITKWNWVVAEQSRCHSHMNMLHAKKKAPSILATVMRLSIDFYNSNLTICVCVSSSLIFICSNAANVRALVSFSISSAMFGRSKRPFQTTRDKWNAFLFLCAWRKGSIELKSPLHSANALKYCQNRKLKENRFHVQSTNRPTPSRTRRARAHEIKSYVECNDVAQCRANGFM